MAQFVAPVEWRQLASDVWKTDLGEGFPEVAILRMSDEEFRKFHSSARFAQSYIDKHKYLKRKLIKFKFVSVVGRRGSKKPWCLILTHTPESTANLIAWQGP
jgi:hypothetical protein